MRLLTHRYLRKQLFQINPNLLRDKTYKINLGDKMSFATKNCKA